MKERHKEYKKKKAMIFKDKSSIIDFLNNFGQSSLQNSYSPLKIKENDLDILLDLANEKIESIKDMLEFKEGKACLGIYFLFVFKALFIGEFDFKTDNLKKKKDEFIRILNFNIKQKLDPELQQFGMKMVEKIGTKELPLFTEIFKGDIVYFIYLFLRYNEVKLLDLNEFVIRLVESFRSVKLDFNYDELKDIPHEQIMEGLSKIFFEEKKDTNFLLYIEKGQMKARTLSNEELAEFINTPITFNNKPVINEKKATGKEIPKKVEPKDSVKKKDEIKTKEEANEEKVDKKNKIQNKNEIKYDSQQMKKMMEEIEILKKIQEKNEENIRILQNYKERSEKQINSLKQTNDKQNEEICRLKSDLKLIKLRRAFKVFVNYIYIGLRLKGDFTYESKVERVINMLGTFTSDDYDKNLAQNSINFMDELYDKIDSGNYAAHHLDLDSSVLDQIFTHIDKNKIYDTFRNKLKYGCKAEKTIKELIKNREDNFLDKDKLKEEEKKINSTIENLRLLWLKK